MAFKGTLKEFKVPDILQLISLQKKTGILTFTSSEGFITLIFDQGSIVGVDSFPKKLEMRVGNVLVKQDYISEEMLQRALTIQKRTNQKIGEILIGMGLVGEDTIKQSLVTQAVEIVLSLFKWKKGEYNFKIMDHLDRSMKMIDPIQTDNLIMEGVQMLDEWPLIRKLIPEDSMIFEPTPVDAKNIEIIDEYDDEMDRKKNSGTTYLNETEANLLKYINGKNTVAEVVELGAFTEYKVYKGLYNLIGKKLIQVMEKDDLLDLQGEGILPEVKIDRQGVVDKFYALLLLLLLLIFAFTFFQPLGPFKDENIMLKTDLYKNVFPTDTDAPNSGQTPAPTKKKR